MDTSLISAILDAQSGTNQVAMALDLMRMNADASKAIVQVLDAANQNAKAMVAQGIGTNLDISV